MGLLHQRHHPEPLARPQQRGDALHVPELALCDGPAADERPSARLPGAIQPLREPDEGSCDRSSRRGPLRVQEPRGPFRLPDRPEDLPDALRHLHDPSRRYQAPGGEAGAGEARRRYARRAGGRPVIVFAFET